MKLQEWKSDKIIINSIDDIIKLGRSNKLTPKQFNDVLSHCSPFVGIFTKDYENTIEMAEKLHEFNKTWQHTIEKPIFID